MSEIEQAFEKYLKSNLSCDKVNEEMNKLSNYSLDRKADEELFINSFINYCSKHFFNHLTELNNNGNKFSANEVFKISHHILTCEANDANSNSIYYKKIKLLYKTFFFLEYDIKNETNDFTFYMDFDIKNETNDFTFFMDFPKNKIENYETYLYNIGISILDSKDSIPFIKILFSKETPIFLKNIILTCFEYIRSTKKNPLDFIDLCIPCLNLSNLYYLIHVIYTELNYKFNNIKEINYIKLENFIHNYSKSEVIIDDFNKNITNIKIAKKEIVNTNIPINEEMSKYFHFSNEDEKQDNLNFFNENNLKDNKKKFQDFLKTKNIQNEKKYNILYDQFVKNDKSINAFSFPILLKNQIVEKIDEHFFQIYNYGNIKVELFSYLLLKYINLINEYLNSSISQKEKNKLFENSGFYKLNNQYVFLININEDDEKVFYLKMNLGQNNVTSRNKDINFEVLNINKSDCSISKFNSESEYFYSEDNNEKALYNFGNYSYEKDIRTFIKNLIKDNNKIYELPRLYFFLNYCIPISKNEFQFITNMKIKIPEDNKIHPYGFSELDFVLKNDSNEDIKMDVEYLPYKEKIFMVFPKEKINNNNKMILKKKSIIFFEFKVSFPEFFWKEKFNLLFKKIKNFLEIYKKKQVYSKEYIQIYFVYDNMPEIYNISEMKKYIIINFSKMFENFEFGIYYFSRAISLINNEQNMKDLRNNIATVKDELDKTKKFMNDILSLFDLIPNKEVKERLEKLKNEFIEKKSE